MIAACAAVPLLATSPEATAAVTSPSAAVTSPPSPAVTSTPSPVPVIIDTDLFSSVDDAGALATAFALQKQGEANVLAIALNTRTANGQHPVSSETYRCAAALRYYYGSTVPIGTQTALGAVAPNSPDFVTPCGQLEPSGVSADPPLALSIYENALGAAADNSVVIICTGYEGNLAALLKAEPTLVATKVAMLVVMGGFYGNTASSTTAENNFYGDPADAAYVAANWPTKIVYDGEAIGGAVTTGQTISTSQPAYSPLRAAYEAFVGADNYYYSYDLTAAYYGIDAQYSGDATAGGVFTPVQGQNTVDPTTGDNQFTPSASGNQYYLKFAGASDASDAADATGLGHTLESLLDYVPAAPTGVTAPAETAPPTITGTAEVGQTLTASTGTWTGNPTHYTYRWLECGSPSSCQAIGGASASTYQPAARTVGTQLEVEVWASVPGAASGPVTSAPTATVASAPVTTPPPSSPPPSSPPPSSNTPPSNTPPSSPPPSSNTPPSSPPPSSNTPPSSPLLPNAPQPPTTTAPVLPISTVTAKPPSRSSAVAVAPREVAAPVISGRPITGMVLSAHAGTWAGATPLRITYQWQRRGDGWSSIRGATSSSYRPTAADTGARLRVLITVTNAAGTKQVHSRVVGPIESRAAIAAGAALNRALRQRGRAAWAGSLLRRDRRRFAFRAPSAGQLVVRWLYRPRHGRQLLVARARQRVRNTGRTWATLRLTPRGRVLLRRHHGRLELIARGTFTPRGQRAVRVTTRIVLRAFR